MGKIKNKNDFINKNLGLVGYCAKKFLHNNYEYDYKDLFQVGCIGLIRAVNYFNIDKNNKFSTYAIPMIFGTINRYLRDNQYIKVSRKQLDMISKLNRNNKYLLEKTKKKSYR